jgi:gamma-glutamylcyclotransferase (GGCT)/AIG2-like uncharacterized protein YtfP
MSHRAELVSEAICKNMKLLNIGSFPGMIASDKEEDMVKGELYLLPDPESIINILDRIEGVPFLFRREEVEVICNGEPCTAWAYTYNSSKNKSYDVIESGDFLDI